MKKLALFLGVLVVLVGVYFVVDRADQERLVTGDWSLAFALPSGWLMVDGYNAPFDEPVTLDLQVTRADGDVVIQNTDKALVLSSGRGPEESVPADTYSKSGTRINVLRLDGRRIIPSAAEDLGGGFYKFKLCEVGEDCQIGGGYNYEYYLDTGTDKYQFRVQLREDERELVLGVVERIVLSAQVVDQVQ